MNKHHVTNMMRLDNARHDERDVIRRYWIEAFHHENAAYIDAYFDTYYSEKTCYVYRDEEGTIISVSQVRSKVLSLHDRNIRVSYLVGSFTRPEYQGQGMMRNFLTELLALLSQTDMLTLMSAYEPKVFESMGFETVIDDYEYNINSKDLLEFGIDGIHLNPESHALKQVYDSFASHFTGYFQRSVADFDALKKAYRSQKGKIIGVTRNKELVGYAIYIQHNGYCEVVECCYDKSGTLLQLLSFISRGQNRIILRATTAEQVRRLIGNVKRVKRPFILAKVNDEALFERLYHIRILSAYSAFHAFGKPLFNRDFQ